MHGQWPWGARCASTSRHCYSVACYCFSLWHCLYMFIVIRVALLVMILVFANRARYCIYSSCVMTMTECEMKYMFSFHDIAIVYSSSALSYCILSLLLCILFTISRDSKHATQARRLKFLSGRSPTRAGQAYVNADRFYGAAYNT